MERMYRNTCRIHVCFVEPETLKSTYTDTTINKFGHSCHIALNFALYNPHRPTRMCLLVNRQL
jgi:hypothetical protein